MSDKNQQSQTNAHSSDKGQAIPRTVFSVDTFQPNERFSVWKESISFIFDVEAAKDIQQDQFKAMVDARMFGQLVLARTTTQQQIWNRSEQNIAKDCMNHFMIQIFEAGCMWYERDGQQIIVDQSGIIIFDLSRTSQTWTNDFTNLSIILPRHLLEPHLRKPDDLHLHFLPGSMPLASLLIDHVKSLKSMADMLKFQQAMDANPATISLLAACLNNAEMEHLCETPKHDAALGMLARKYIEEQLHDTDLSADKLALMMSISRSRLYEIFKPYGGVRAYIQKRRLRIAYNRLIDPAFTHRSISEVAYSTGFRNDSAFSQVFKKSFGISPKEARSSKLHYYLSVDRNSEIDRRYEDWIRKL